MKIKSTNFKNLKIIQSKNHEDSRGFFKELWLKKKIKFNCKFTAISCSKKNVIRVLHYQNKKKQSNKSYYY